MSKSLRAKVSRNAAALFGSALMIMGGLSCGGTSSNDQGTSFRAIGYFTFCDPDEPDVDALCGLSRAGASLFADAGGTLFGIGDGKQLGGTFIGFTNDLLTQFIRLDRIECSYDIQGASIGIPNDSASISTILGPRCDSITAAGECVEPPEVEGAISNPEARIQAVEFQVVSPDLFAYLNVNQSSLPPLPFRMTASCRGVGISQAGDVYESNPVNLPIQFFDESEGVLGAEPGDAPGIGGDFAGVSDAGEDTVEAGDTAGDASSSTSSSTTLQ